MANINLHQNDQTDEQHADPFTPYTFDDGTEVRTVMREGDPWFVANDLGIGLKLTNVRDSLQFLETDEKGVARIYTPGGFQKLNIVSEPGMYQLFCMSRKPAAKKFKRWLFHTVLTSIRRTGYYARPGLLTPGLDQQSIVAAVTEAVAARFDVRLAKLEGACARVIRPMPTIVATAMYVPPRDLRGELDALVDFVAVRKGCHTGTVMIELYKEFKRRFAFDYRAKKKRCHALHGVKVSVLDLVEWDGNLPALLSLALVYFPQLMCMDLPPDASPEALFIASVDDLSEEAKAMAEVMAWAREAAV